MKKINLLDNKNEILKFIDENINPKEIEKKKYGEVFTPMKLVDEMINKLDKYYIEERGESVYTILKYKWFDPSVGMGNFLIAIYFKLLEELKQKIPNEKLRKKHILENMLYMSEINEENIKSLKQIFDINNEYKLNIYNGDTLELDIKKQWNIDKFDIIIGNPPYNNYDENSKKVKRGGSNNLYEKFISYSLKILKQNGYLVFITPCSWFSCSKKNQILRKEILNKKILYLDISTTNKKYFKNVGNNFVWFVIKNSDIENNIVEVSCLYNKKIYNSNIKQKLFRKEFIPLLLNDTSLEIINKIINYNDEEKIIAKLPYEYEPRKSSVTKIKPKNEKYVIIRGTKKSILYSTRITDYANKYKIIIPTTRKYEDMEITTNVTTQSYINIVCESEKEAIEIEKMLKLDIFKFFNNICRYGNWNYSEIISLFPNLSQIENIYDELNITKNELEFINKILNKL